MIKYEESTDLISGNVTIVRTDDNGEKSYIPSDSANSDYQAYLRWLENPDADESGTL
jgi:hypothetical protein